MQKVESTLYITDDKSVHIILADDHTWEQVCPKNCIKSKEHALLKNNMCIYLHALQINLVPRLMVIETET